MSHPFDRKDIIDFLVRRKFPSTALAALSNGPARRGTTTLGRLQRHEQIDRYRSELQILPADQLRSLYETEYAAAQADVQREEDARFYNQPHAAADFDHWCRAEHWTLEEAIALTMGKAPEIVSWDKIKTYSAVSPFVQRYARLRDLAERAKLWRKLYDPVLPTIFLKWAEDNEIDVPIELREKVAKLRGKLVDWKKNYDELLSIHEQRIHDWKAVSQEQMDLIEAHLARIRKLEAELTAIKEAPPALDPAKAQSPIERQNMLKAIYAMALGGYAYDPTQKRSPTVSEIASDMALAGLPLSEDTIRRYLKEASDKLDDWREQSR